MHPRALRVAAALLGLGLIATLATSAPRDTQTPQPSTPEAPTVAPKPAPDEAAARNVILILADDLSWDTWNTISRLKDLEARGTTLTSHVVTDSLCCPSRVSIMRSQYVHNHNVTSNIAATGGGFDAFDQLDLDKDCLPTWLRDHGVTTAQLGKYLNEYPGQRDETHIPDGWTHWAVPTTNGAAYKGRNYRINVDGRIVDRTGTNVFLEDELAQHAVDIITSHPNDTPLYLQYASYLPHKPAPVADRWKDSHRGTHENLTLSDAAKPKNAPTWMQDLPDLTRTQVTHLSEKAHKRSRSAEALADSIDAILDALKSSGKLENTLILVTSDNGYHIASRGLPYGKRTAYHDDTVVPLVVIGPGIKAGQRIGALTSTVDLAPTIASWLGAPTPAWIDGRPLQPLLANPMHPWRDAVLSEALSESTPGDPDYSPYTPEPFTALRTHDWLAIEYRSGELELYDLARDPNETTNVAASTPTSILSDLRGQLARARTCEGDSCWLTDKPS